MSYPFMRLVEPNHMTAAMAEVHRCLAANPASTAGELEKKFNNPNLHKRLSELYRVGLADKGPKRHCKVSKRKVDTWIAKPLPNS